MTKRLGKVSALARGARRSRRRFMGALEPFAVLEVEMAAGRGELWRLRQAQVSRSFPGLMRDLEKMAVAGGAVELVRMGMPERDPDPVVFATTVALFELVDHAKGALQEALLCFRLRIMAVLGFAPCLDRCGRCGKPAGENRAALFDPLAGHLVCRACGGAGVHLGAETRRRLLQALGPSWRHAVTPWTSGQLEDARAAVCTFVEHRLGASTSKFPESRQGSSQ